MDKLDRVQIEEAYFKKLVNQKHDEIEFLGKVYNSIPEGPDGDAFRERFHKEEEAVYKMLQGFENQHKAARERLEDVNFELFLAE